MSYAVENATCARYFSSLLPFGPCGPWMISLGLSALPAIFLIASSIRFLS